MMNGATQQIDKSSADLIRIGVLQSIFDTALDLGADLRVDFAARGLTPSLLAQGDALFRLKDISDFLLLAAKRTRCDHFSLELAARQDVSFLGSIGLLMQTAPNMGEALKKLGQYGHAHAQPVTWTIDTSHGAEILAFALDLQGLDPVRHRLCAELGLAQCHNVISAITGRPPSIDRVFFTSVEPSDPVAFSRYFRAPVTCNAEFYGFEFTPGTLDTPVIYSDHALHSSVRQHLNTPDLHVITFDRQIRAVIRTLLPTNTLSIDRVAKAFGCDKRTLQRWIKRDYGVTYNDIVEDVRFDLARQYLSQSKMSVTNASLAVGYSDPTNFTRAFKKAVGCSPREWRKQNAIPTRSRPQLLPNF